MKLLEKFWRILTSYHICKKGKVNISPGKHGHSELRGHHALAWSPQPFPPVQGSEGSRRHWPPPVGPRAVTTSSLRDLTWLPGAAGGEQRYSERLKFHDTHTVTILRFSKFFKCFIFSFTFHWSKQECLQRHLVLFTSFYAIVLTDFAKKSYNSFTFSHRYQKGKHRFTFKKI